MMQFTILSILSIFATNAYSQNISNPLPAGDIHTADDVVGNDLVPSAYSFSTSFEKVVIVRLKYKTDLLQGLKDAAKEQNIKNAVILSGIGSVYSYHVHSVDNATFPSENVFFKKEKPANCNKQAFLC